MREGDLTIDEVLQALAAYLEITREELLHGRPRARRLAKYLAVRMTRCSLQQVGSAFGGVHYKNVVCAVRMMERSMDEDPALAAAMVELKASLVGATRV